jgi:Glu-tRNA(Gln) amidotransferase subunit E-like FAD-binding protein
MMVSGMAVHLATLSEEVKDSEIIAKMLRSLLPHFKQITIAIKTLLDVSTMSVVDLTWRFKEAEEAFEEALTSLQQDGKLYLIEEEWDTQRKKRETEIHSGSGARGGGTGRGYWRS